MQEETAAEALEICVAVAAQNASGPYTPDERAPAANRPNGQWPIAGGGRTVGQGLG